MFWKIARSLLFRADAERVHLATMAVFVAVASIPGMRWIFRKMYTVSALELEREVLGIRFPNPIGLAAGFDKNAEWFNELGTLGFGFIEVGTLTAHAQPGNEKPRLFRLPLDRALLNRFGFNNKGAAAAAQSLSHQKILPIIGVNIGKSKVTPNEAAGTDYLQSLRLLHEFAKYFVVNVSSPNTPGLRGLQDREPLTLLLSAVVAELKVLAGGAKSKPVLVKIAPDLTDDQLRDVVELCLEVGIDGIIATNTTIDRSALRTPAAEVQALGAGGVSGAPLTSRSVAMVARIRELSGGKLVIIGVGGVMNGQDAWNMLQAGASLVQVYSGFIYGGPGFAAKLNREILSRLRKSLPDSPSHKTLHS